MIVYDVSRAVLAATLVAGIAIGLGLARRLGKK